MTLSSKPGPEQALFTSFIWATMRRNLLCCRPGAFVQWMAWYNLTRTHRDRPMLDREFMHALEMTHEEPSELEAGRQVRDQFRDRLTRRGEQPG